MPQWVVFRQLPSTSPCADLWDMEYVDVEAENQKEACETTAMDKGEGRYCAFPNTTAEYFEIKIRKIAEVESAPGESLV